MTTSATFQLTINLATGETYNFNSAGEAWTVDGTSQNSFKPQTFEITRELASKTVRFRVPRLEDANGTLSFAMTSDTMMTDARVRYSLVVGNTLRPLLYGRVSELQMTDAYLEISVTSFLENLKYTKVAKLSNICRNRLGDTRCGVALPAFTELVTVDTISEDRLSFTILETIDEQYYQDGVIRLIFPARDIELDIAVNDTNTIYTWERLPMFFSDGQQFNITAGCNRTESACRGKFNNFLNFGGLPTGVAWSPTLLESIAGAGN